MAAIGGNSAGPGIFFSAVCIGGNSAGPRLITVPIVSYDYLQVMLLLMCTLTTRRNLHLWRCDPFKRPVMQ